MLVGVAAWAGANGQDDLRAQIPWLNLAVGAAVVAACTQAWWLLEARRTISLQRREVVQRRRAPQSGGSRVSAVPTAGRRYTVTGSTWHHDPQCILVAGKPLLVVEEPDERDRCDVCRST